MKMQGAKGGGGASEWQCELHLDTTSCSRDFAGDTQGPLLSLVGVGNMWRGAFGDRCVTQLQQQQQLNPCLVH